MNDFIFVLGGTRSGKSEIGERFAKEKSEKCQGTVLYLATCQAEDEELKKRVALHQKRRPELWQTLEEATDPVAGLESLHEIPPVILIDCLSFLIFNWQQEVKDDSEILDRASRLLDYIQRLNRVFIIVSHDAGGGLIPANRFSRRYQDLIGLANQMAARRASEVYMAVAGIPVSIKNKKDL